jgi:hypothetical protein
VIPLKWLRGRGALALLAVAGCSLACGRGAEPETTGETIAVTVQPARIGSLRYGVRVRHRRPAAAADSVVTADQPAKSLRFHNEGDTVKTGDVLVRLDIPS